MVSCEWDQGLRKGSFPAVVHIRADKEILEFGGKAWKRMRVFNQLEGAFRLVFPRVCYMLLFALHVRRAQSRNEISITLSSDVLSSSGWGSFAFIFLCSTQGRKWSCELSDNPVAPCLSSMRLTRHVVFCNIDY